jgi:nitrate/nitrite transporter NarK
MYMAGCLVGPLVATAIATTDSRWYLFYVVPSGLGIINLTLIVIAFRDNMTVRMRRHVVDQSGQSSVGHDALLEMKNTLRLPAVWIMSLYFFFFLGAAVTAGGEAYSSLLH